MMKVRVLVGKALGRCTDETNHCLAAEFLSFLSLFNFYIYTLAFVYLPSGISSTSSSDLAKRIGVARLDEDDDDNGDILLSIRKGVASTGSTTGGRKSNAIGMIGDPSEESANIGQDTFTDLDVEHEGNVDLPSETSSEAF